jgi:hypothetical protein
MAALISIWFVGGIVNARYYYRRRHGLLLTPGAQGKNAAVLFSMFWPIALFAPAYRGPQLCTHQAHVRRRADNRQVAAEHEQLVREERGQL